MSNLENDYVIARNLLLDEAILGAKAAIIEQIHVQMTSESYTDFPQGTMAPSEAIRQKGIEVKGRKEEAKKENFKNVNSTELDLSNVLQSFKSKIPSSYKENNELSLVNVRARLRMTTLYYFAQINNYLVLGTGNKVEDFGVGFFTKYGDGGVDISPIADLLKTEVYLLSSHLGINKEIIEAAPTDGLWEDEKTDEEQLGASYTELEWAMNFNGNIKHLTERQKIVLEIYTTMHNKNQHKMIEIPICKIPNSLK